MSRDQAHQLDTSIYSGCTTAGELTHGEQELDMLTCAGRVVMKKLYHIMSIYRIIQGKRGLSPKEIKSQFMRRPLDQGMALLHGIAPGLPRFMSVG